MGDALDSDKLRQGGVEAGPGHLMRAILPANPHRVKWNVRPIHTRPALTRSAGTDQDVCHSLVGRERGRTGGEASESGELR
jgi:hypothetical protein